MDMGPQEDQLACPSCGQSKLVATGQRGATEVVGGHELDGVLAAISCHHCGWTDETETFIAPDGDGNAVTLIPKEEQNT